MMDDGWCEVAGASLRLRSRRSSRTLSRAKPSNASAAGRARGYARGTAALLLLVCYTLCIASAATDNRALGSYDAVGERSCASAAVEVDVHVPQFVAAARPTAAPTAHAGAHAAASTAAVTLAQLWRGRRWCAPFMASPAHAHACALRALPQGRHGASMLQLAGPASAAMVLGGNVADAAGRSAHLARIARGVAPIRRSSGGRSEVERLLAAAQRAGAVAGGAADARFCNSLPHAAWRHFTDQVVRVTGVATAPAVVTVSARVAALIPAIPKHLEFVERAVAAVTSKASDGGVAAVVVVSVSTAVLVSPSKRDALHAAWSLAAGGTPVFVDWRLGPRLCGGGRNAAVDALQARIEDSSVEAPDLVTFVDGEHAASFVPSLRAISHFACRRAAADDVAHPERMRLMLTVMAITGADAVLSSWCAPHLGLACRDMPSHESMGSVGTDPHAWAFEVVGPAEISCLTFGADRAKGFANRNKLHGLRTAEVARNAHGPLTVTWEALQTGLRYDDTMVSVLRRTGCALI